jgi:hypothetical protein
MGLRKQILKQWVESGCDRQLFLSLMTTLPLRGSERWSEGVIEVDVQDVVQHGASVLGVRYEQAVYKQLEGRAWTVAALDARGNTTATRLTPERLRGLGSQPRPWVAAGDEAWCLIEHQWVSGVKWLAECLGDNDGAQSVENANGLGGALRPDILLVTPGEALIDAGTSKRLRMLGPLGEVVTASAEEVAGRFGVQIIDIKRTHERSVGKRHFIEIAYYAHAFNAYLTEHGLSDLFFVCCDGHGILPRLEPLPLVESSAHLRSLCVETEWDNAAFLLNRALKKVRDLWTGRPWDVNAVEVNIQPSCGRCGFFGDCMARLGASGEGSRSPGEKKTRGALDVRLMPYVSGSLAAQLRAHGLYTVGDVAKKLLHLDLGDTPTALHPERPVLALQAKAIVRGERMTAKQARMGEQHLSVSAPRDCTARLVVDAEADPTSDVVFSVGLHLKIGSGGVGLHAVEVGWWGFWRAWLMGDCDIKNISTDSALATLHPSVLAGRERGYFDLQIMRFGRALGALYTQARELPSAARMEISDKKTMSAQRLWLDARYTYTSDSNTWDSERTLARNTLLGLHHLVTVCDVLESLLWVPEDDEHEGDAAFHLMAGFYWSTEQRTQLQEMLERHLERLLIDDDMQAPLLDTLSLLAPSASAVQHPKQREKFFNLREFIETSWGVPHLINCTWHGMARSLDPQPFLSQGRFSAFWAPHFNYMNHMPWHSLIAEPDFDRKYLQRSEINEQLRFKLQSLHTIIDALFLDPALHHALISRASLTPSTAALRVAQQVPGHWHALARGWHLFASLSAATQRAAAEAARLTYPAKSIGKLVAAQAESLHLEGANIRLFLCGLSANIKLAPGDYALLVCEQDRDLPAEVLRHYEIQIIDMRWDHAQRRQEVLASSFRQQHPYLQAADAQGVLQLDGPCYVYLTAFDAWTERLGAALNRRGIAESWLGERIAFLWGLHTPSGLDEPPQSAPDCAEFYLFAPTALPPVSGVAGDGLLTTAYPQPDPSQVRCIEHALGQTLSCIQGPPGTGKSQTIAALIDAFVRRQRQQKRPTRILITAASYAALQVLLDKLTRHSDKHQKPTAAALLTKYFSRSAARAPAASAPGYPPPNDLVIGAKYVTLNNRKVGAKWLHQAKETDGDFILFATPHQLVSLRAQHEKNGQLLWLPQDFGFDLIVVDEASQMPTDQFLAVVALTKPIAARGALSVLDDQLQPTAVWPAQGVGDVAHVRADFSAGGVFTQIVLVGDHHQLPPVQSVKPPEKLRIFLDSVFRFYAEGHQITPMQLEINYRSHPDIVACTRLLNLYGHLEASPGWERKIMQEHPGLGWVNDVLNSDHAVGVLVHDQPYETAVSPLEAKLVVACVVGALGQWGAQNAEDERNFWRTGVGVVTPHNAQGRLIVRLLYEQLMANDSSYLSGEVLMGCLQETVYSVEKFQGSDRVLMLASIGVSSPEQLLMEEGFIYDLNRFNVLTSRARQKMILVCSRAFLEHVPGDRRLMSSAGRVREMALGFCAQSKYLDVAGEERAVEYRWHATHTREAPDAGSGSRSLPAVSKGSAFGGVWGNAPQTQNSSKGSAFGGVWGNAPQTQNSSKGSAFGGVWGNAPQTQNGSKGSTFGGSGQRPENINIETPAPATPKPRKQKASKKIEPEKIEPPSPEIILQDDEEPQPMRVMDASQIPNIQPKQPQPSPAHSAQAPSYLLMAHNALTRRHPARHILDAVSQVWTRRGGGNETGLAKEVGVLLGLVRLDAASEDYLVRCIRWVASQHQA